MPLTQLADVELQLIIHGLDRRELLQFARCSRQLMHAADAPFAWQRCPLIRVHSSSAPIVPTLASQRLMRHVRSAIHFDLSALFLRLAAQSELLNAHAQLVELDFSSWLSGGLEPVLFLLAHPSAQRLLTLNLHAVSDVRVLLQFLGTHAAPRLQCLVLRPSCVKGDESSIPTVASLVQLLQTAPLLQCTLHVKPKKGTRWEEQQHERKAGIQLIETLHASLELKLLTAAARFKMVIDQAYFHPGY